MDSCLDLADDSWLHYYLHRSYSSVLVKEATEQGRVVVSGRDLPLPRSCRNGVWFRVSCHTQEYFQLGLELWRHHLHRSEDPWHRPGVRCAGHSGSSDCDRYFLLTHVTYRGASAAGNRSSCYDGSGNGGSFGLPTDCVRGSTYCICSSWRRGPWSA